MVADGVTGFKISLLIPVALCLFASTCSAASFSLVWDDNVDSVSGYRIYMREKSSGEFARIWEGPENRHVLDDTALRYDTVYVFVVRAFNYYGESGNSNPVEYIKQVSPGALDDDDDNDGMPNIWEISHGLNSKDLGDAGQDPDGDGLDNLGEFEMGHDPFSKEIGLGRAVILQPVNDVLCIDFSEKFIANYASGVSKEIHTQTVWQIAQTSSFDSLDLDITSSGSLTELSIPETVLKPNSTYIVRARYIDGVGLSDRYWPWSYPVTFYTCGLPGGDENWNQIPDDQEPDNLLVGEMAVTLPDNSGTIYFDTASNAKTIEALTRVPGTDIPVQDVSPGELVWGMFAFRVIPENSNQPLVLNIQCSKPLPHNAVWYKYDGVNGWHDYSEFVTFSEDRTSLAIELMDGGLGDADGVANGVIVDPSGPVVPASGDDPVEVESNSGSGGGGCFISSISADDVNWKTPALLYSWLRELF